MLLGTRQIRSSGKGSGSIELTMPAELRDLVGLPCRIILRDGSRPDIVLQPDMKGAIDGFSHLWRGLAGALQDEREPLRMRAFSFGLQPATGRNAPYLCWRDGLALAFPPPHDPIAVSRTLAAFGQVLAAELGVAAELACGFGAACAYLTIGVAPKPDAQEICDLAASCVLDMSGTEAAAVLAGLGQEDATSASFWQKASPRLITLADVFRRWTKDPSSLARLRSTRQRGSSRALCGD
jgi:hypothetical protein